MKGTYGGMDVFMESHDNQNGLPNFAKYGVWLHAEAGGGGQELHY